MKISGTFDVKMEPLTYSGQPQEGIQIARMLLDKTFHGDLSATSKGEMLSAVTPAQRNRLASEQTPFRRKLLHPSLAGKESCP